MGYTFEAISKVIQYGFDEFGLTRIGAVVFRENEASIKLLTKAGFEKEGILRDYMYQNGEAFDTYVYSIIKDNR
jgi:[ribosomal protein S5]-alanine N-acetyltransferase